DDRNTPVERTHDHDPCLSALWTPGPAGRRSETLVTPRADCRIETNRSGSRVPGRARGADHPVVVSGGAVSTGGGWAKVRSIAVPRRNVSLAAIERPSTSASTLRPDGSPFTSPTARPAAVSASA